MRILYTEIERKYLIDKKDTEREILSIPHFRTGILQWYLDNNEKNTGGSERLRLEIFINEGKLERKWSYGYKKPIGDSLERRLEFEKEIDREENPYYSFERLKGYPCIFKIRNYFYQFQEAECVLDLFASVDNYIFPDFSLFEIELKKEKEEKIFDSVIRKLGLENIVTEVTDNKEYTNHQIAIKVMGENMRKGRSIVEPESAILSIEKKLLKGED